MLPYLTQSYAFGIGVTQDLNQACQYFAHVQDNDEFMRTSSAVDDLIALFNKHNIQCTKNPNIIIADKEQVRDWYNSRPWGED